MVETIIYAGSVISIFLFIGALYLVSFAQIRQILYRKILFQRYDDILLTFEHMKLVAYDFIFQNDIYVYASSKQRIDSKDMGPIQAKFIKKVLDLCGPSIITDMEQMRGSLDSIILELSCYFITKVNKDEDEIFKNISDPNADMDTRSKMNVVRAKSKFSPQFPNVGSQQYDLDDY